jgi:enoyl-CoA hydratase/carnithine racemase
MSPFRASAPLTGHWDHFGFSVADAVATVRFDRPGKLNALTFEAYADLRDLLAELPDRGDVRVLVLRGSGMAAGAGAVIALAADFRVCTPSARFAFLFTKVGLSGGDMGAAYLLPRLVGLGHATRLLMLGDTIAAEEAARIGLISSLVEADGFDDAVAALARRLATGPAQAYAQTKALLTREQDMSLSAAIELEAMTQALLMKGEDYAEFHAAFNAGRPPRWTGR